MEASMTTTTSKPIHVLPDILNGAFRGDWTPRLGVAGAVTQAIVFYIPVIGTLCAIRDFFACLHKHDSLGSILNALAVFPVLGGFPKTADVIHNFVTINHAYRATRIATGHSSEPVEQTKISNPLAGLSLLIAAMTPVLLVLPWLFSLPGNLILVGLAAPIVAIVLGHLALGRAKHHRDAHAHRGTARVALVMGYFYFVVVGTTVWLLLSTGHHVGPFSLPS